MNRTPETFDDLYGFADRDGSDSYAALAHEWIASHPDAMDLFVRLALLAASRSRRIGAKAIVERMRWEYAIEKGDEEFALNNNYTAYLAREAISRCPELNGSFELRRPKHQESVDG
jgi:hypothetical protein